MLNGMNMVRDINFVCMGFNCDGVIVAWYRDGVIVAWYRNHVSVICLQGVLVPKIFDEPNTTPALYQEARAIRYAVIMSATKCRCFKY